MQFPLPVMNGKEEESFRADDCFSGESLGTRLERRESHFIRDTSRAPSGYRIVQ